MTISAAQLLDAASFRIARSAHRLVLDPRAPVYPRSAGSIDLRDERVAEGVYELSGSWQRRWVVVRNGRVTAVAECEAMRALGAVEVLLSLQLGDAAISLELGDLTNARYQWLRHRDGL